MIRILVLLTLALPACAAPLVVDLRPGDGPVIQAAIDALPRDAGFVLLKLAPGTYREKLHLPKDTPPVKLLGEPGKTTRIVWGDGADTPDDRGDSLGTRRSASVTIESDDFAAENIVFENDRGPGIQAVALVTTGDRGVFRRCTFLGWQDTLYVRRKRQFFDTCHIAGSVDFIFGGANAYFQQCTIECRDDGYITAASTAEESEFGFVFDTCTVTAKAGARVYLGRPWQPHASVHFLTCDLPAEIRPEGWDNWGDPDNEKTARYFEWRCHGKGAATGRRVGWSQSLTDPAGRGIARPWRVLHKWDPDFVLSPERISTLPAGEQEAWWAYLDRSQKAMAHARATLREELAAENLEKPRKPKDGGRPPRIRRDRSWFDSDEARDLARAVISFQAPFGGWSKSLDYTQGVRPRGTHWSGHGGGDLPWHYVGTLDNDATVGELLFLAHYRAATGEKEAREAILRGLDYLFAAQFPNGGWPQVWPLEGGYHDQITLNDDAMTNVLNLLADIAEGKETFSFLDANRKAQAARALTAGVNCLLAMQVRKDGRPTVWCAQHDPLTLRPSGARLHEPASLSSSESVIALRFLMRRVPRTTAIGDSVEGALAWFEANKVTGIRRVERASGRYFEVGIDDSGLWWARFTDLESGSPLFTGSRDGNIYHTFAECAENNPTDYSYYTTEARSLLEKDGPRGSSSKK